MARIIVLAPFTIGDSVSNIFSANGWHTPPTRSEVPLPWITYASIREINPPWDMVFVGGLTTNCAKLSHNGFRLHVEHERGSASRAADDLFASVDAGDLDALGQLGFDRNQVRDDLPD